MLPQTASNIKAVYLKLIVFWHNSIKKNYRLSVEALPCKANEARDATTGLRSVKDVGYCSAMRQAVLVTICGSKLGCCFQQRLSRPVGSKVTSGRKLDLWIRKKYTFPFF